VLFFDNQFLVIDNSFANEKKKLFFNVLARQKLIDLPQK